MPNRVSRALSLLGGALRFSLSHDKQARAARIRKAVHDLRTHGVRPAPKPVNPTIHFDAIAAAMKQSATGIPHHGSGECLMAVRECYGFPAVEDDAIGSWSSSAHKHRVSDPNRIPRGVPVYWSGGSKGHGHIAIANGDGTCWSTDIKRIGFFDRVPITQIHDHWGLTLLGWSEEVNGFLVPQIGAVR